MAIDLKSVTRNSILKAIAECDQMGREVFRDHYEFGKSTRFLVHYAGKLYDSKAIVGVAHKHETGRLASNTEFSGGDRTNAVLRRCGFGIVDLCAFTSPDELRTRVEGATTTITVNRYERDPDARAKCLAKHGWTCGVCAFDFAAVYGTRGDAYIHVHHLHPVSLGEREVVPEVDLLPVCANCHAMLHRGELWTPEQLRAAVHAHRRTS